VTGSSARQSSASEPIALAAGEIRLWLGRAVNYADSDQFRRECLSHCADQAPAAWRFASSEHGKPRLQDSPLPLDFNLSHSGDWLACAVTSAGEVGVDLEQVDRERDVLRVARRYFSAREIESLTALPPGQRQDRFYDLWTLKEAWIKARGLTLAGELQGAAFRFGSPGLVELECADASSPATFWLLDWRQDYRLALCASEPQSGTTTLRVFEALPGGGERPLQLPLRAASGVAGGVT